MSDLFDDLIGSLRPLQPGGLYGPGPSEREEWLERVEAEANRQADPRIRVLPVRIELTAEDIKAASFKSVFETARKSMLTCHHGREYPCSECDRERLARDEDRLVNGDPSELSSEEFAKLLASMERVAERPEILRMPDGGLLMYKPSEEFPPITFEPTFDLPERPGLSLMSPRFGAGVVPRPSWIVRIDWPRGPGAEAMIADGWVFDVPVWRRGDDGVISHRSQASGRYAERLPTNRKRKRQRAKARRRGRLGGRHG